MQGDTVNFYPYFSVILHDFFRPFFCIGKEGDPRPGELRFQDKASSFPQKTEALLRERETRYNETSLFYSYEKKGDFVLSRKNKTPNGNPKKSRTRKVLGIVAIIIAVIALIVGAVFGVFESYYGKMNFQELKKLKEVDTNDPDLAEYLAYLKENGISTTDLAFDDENVLNVLLVGTDKESGGSARSDSMMIVSVNQNTKQITMTSLLRDCYVYIPGHGSAKLNAAYSYGGISLLLQTIEYNFHIPIKKYAIVGYDAFPDVIEAIGGVAVDLTQPEINYIKQNLPNHENENLQVGNCTLDPEQALTHSRNRTVGTDFERTRRQRDIVQAAMKKVKNLSLMELNSLVNDILPYITTNVTRGEIVSALLRARTYAKYKVVSQSIPQPGTYQNKTINGQACLVIDFAKNMQFFRDTVYNGK